MDQRGPIGPLRAYVTIAERSPPRFWRSGRYTVKVEWYGDDPGVDEETIAGRGLALAVADELAELFGAGQVATVSYARQQVLAW